MDFRKLLREAKAEAARDRAGRQDVAPESSTPALENPFTEQPLPPPFDFAPRSALPLPAHAVQDGAIYYIPNWISVDEESSILDQVHAAAPSAWVQLKYRRLQAWGGSVTTAFEPKPLPRWLQALSNGLVEAGVFAASETPNHALINDYAPGDGILPHEDGPMYYPRVAILSTGASGRMTFQRHRQTTPSDVPVHLTLDRRSLLVFTDEAYTEYLHSIDNIDDEHGVNHRISLTIRHVRPPSRAC